MEIPRHDDASLTSFAGLVPFRVRRNGSEIVRSVDRQSYLRRGTPEVIRAELVHHDALVALGYPVPRILARGDGWFVEESLGDQHFGDIFPATPQEHPERPEVFRQFTDVLQRYADAQLREHRVPIDAAVLESRIDFADNEHLFDARGLKDYREMTRRILSAVDGTPGVPCHGDCNAFNIFPRGIIDFEDTFIGPLGYDIASSIISTQAFPERSECPDVESERLYTFSPEENGALAGILTSQVRGEPQNLVIETTLIRWIWHLCRMGHRPILEGFRRRQLEALMRAYLEGTLTVEQVLGIQAIESSSARAIPPGP